MERPTWMINGKPGQIVRLLCQAAKEAGVVPRAVNRQVGDHYDIASVERAARIWQAHGILVYPETSEEIVEATWKNERDTMIVAARLRYSLTLVAPDGSYIVAHSVGAGNSHGGRHFAMARTDARKEVIRVVLQIASEESETAVDVAVDNEPVEWSEPLRTAVAAIDRCADDKELADVGKQDVMGQLDPDERAIARREWKRRQRDLRDLGVLSYSNDLARRSRRT